MARLFRLAKENFFFIFKQEFGMSFINDENVIKRITYLSGISNCVGLVVWGFLIDRLPFKVRLIEKNASKAKSNTFFSFKNRCRLQYWTRCWLFSWVRWPQLSHGISKSSIWYGYVSYTFCIMEFLLLYQ